MLLFFFFALPLPRVSMSVCLFVAWLVCQWEKHKTTEQENEDESWLRRDPINSWFGSKYRDGSSNYLLTFFNIVMLAIFPTFSFQMKTNQALFGGWNLRESTEWSRAMLDIGLGLSELSLYSILAILLFYSLLSALVNGWLQPPDKCITWKWDGTGVTLTGSGQDRTTTSSMTDLLDSCRSDIKTVWIKNCHVLFLSWCFEKHFIRSMFKYWDLSQLMSQRDWTVLPKNDYTSKFIHWNIFFMACSNLLKADL